MTKEEKAAMNVWPAYAEGIAPYISNEMIKGIRGLGEGINKVNSLTIKPDAGVTASITGTYSGPLVRIIAAKYVTIDGSNNGSSTRDLTITNNGTSSPNAVVIGSSGATPSTDVTLKNCVLVNGANTSTAVVVSDGATVGNAGYFQNIVIHNNSLAVHIWVCISVQPSNSRNVTISSNVLSSSNGFIRYVGIYYRV